MVVFVEHKKALSFSCQVSDIFFSTLTRFGFSGQIFVTNAQYLCGGSRADS